MPNKRFRLSPKDETLIIGVLSDTHGHLDPKVLPIMGRSDLILHAGDIGAPDVLKRLLTVGKVVSVRGNMDTGSWARNLPVEEYIEIGEVGLFLLHDLAMISLEPEATNIRVVVSGHTHRPEVDRRNGILYINPGSASLPRGGKATVALLEITGERITCRHVVF